MTATLSPERKLEALRRATELKPFQWACGVPGCDGLPHRGNLLSAMPHRHARAQQIAPRGDWYAWLLMAGRGMGKTRSGAEWAKGRAMAEENHRVAVIAPSFGAGRDICIEGESGLLAILPKNVIRKWNRSIGELILTNGAMFKLFGTDKLLDAEKLRGFQFHTAWFEELGTQVHGQTAWDMLTFGLRLGNDPRVVVTFTPRPIKLIKKLLKDPDIVVTRGSTYDNAHNLAPAMLQRTKSQYEGTNLGRQELYGELLDAAKGALWTPDMLDQRQPMAPPLVRVVVAVDPAGTAKRTSDLTGIIVAGIDTAGLLWVLADKSGRYSPEEWRQVVCTAYEDYAADCVVGEVNFGADMVRSTMRAGPNPPPFKSVTASRGKALRATPVVGLYEQGRVWSVGTHADLEQQMTSWIPPGRFDEQGDPIAPSTESPDRMDALVWGITDLAGLSKKQVTTRTMGGHYGDEEED